MNGDSDLHPVSIDLHGANELLALCYLYYPLSFLLTDEEAAFLGESVFEEELEEAEGSFQVLFSVELENTLY